MDSRRRTLSLLTTTLSATVALVLVVGTGLAVIAVARGPVTLAMQGSGAVGGGSAVTPSQGSETPPTGAGPKSRGSAPLTEMVTYQIGFLRKGPNWTPGESAELGDLQKRHLAHLRKMGESGKLVVAGPLADNTEVRGILIFKGVTTEEAKAMAAEDPAVQAGRLAIDIHPWMVQKGVLP